MRATKEKKKPKVLKMPDSKNKKASSKENSYDELKKRIDNEELLTDKEIGKLLG